MYLGIEIGGTKLQLGVGSGKGGPLETLERCDVNSTGGADGICQQIAKIGKRLIDKHDIRRVGIGFGARSTRREGE